MKIYEEPRVLVITRAGEFVYCTLYIRIYMYCSGTVFCSLPANGMELLEIRSNTCVYR